MKITYSFWQFVENVEEAWLYRIKDFKTGNHYFLWVKSPRDMLLQVATPGGKTTRIHPKDLPDGLLKDVEFRRRCYSDLREVLGRFWDSMTSLGDETGGAADAARCLDLAFDADSLEYLVNYIEQEGFCEDDTSMESLEQLKSFVSRVRSESRS